MVQLCEQLRVDVLIPAVDEELLVLASNLSQFCSEFLMLPAVKYVETMLDKCHMIRELELHNLSVPLTYLLNDAAEGVRFPCIVKPRKGRGSRGVRVVSSLVELRLLRESLCENLEDYIIQNKVEGIEYTVQMVADRTGHLQAVVPVKVNLKRGITIQAIVDDNLDVINKCRLIHQSIPTPGCYNIQLMLTADGDALPFEINPRISTTFCLVVASGIDPIAIYLQPKQQKKLYSFTCGTKLQRNWHNYFSE